MMLAFNFGIEPKN